MSRALDVIIAWGIDLGDVYQPAEGCEELFEEYNTNEDWFVRRMFPSLPEYPYGLAGDLKPGFTDDDGRAYYDAAGAEEEASPVGIEYYGVDYDGMMLVLKRSVSEHGWAMPLPPLHAIWSDEVDALLQARDRLGVKGEPQWMACARYG